MTQTIYTVGGTVQAGGGIYIPRKADDELLVHCRANKFVFILSSRQVGKSSLMERTAQQLEQEGIRSVIIDLSGIGVVGITADQWYLGILDKVTNMLDLKTDIFAWWSERSGLSPAARMTNFFRDVMLKEVSEPIVIFFDEIDSTLSIPFSDDFFVALRAIYNARPTTSDFQRLSFVMIGVATPSDLIKDEKRTKFNVGVSVDLTDFTYKEALPLAGELDKDVLKWILAWTGGHPYLTQRLCAYLSESKAKITENDVAGAVKDLFEGEQGRQDDNLQFVRDMLIKRSSNPTQMLKIYKGISEGREVEDDIRSTIKAHLKISGIVHAQNGYLLPRNQIYSKVFTPNWAQSNIPRNKQGLILGSLLGAAVVIIMILLGLLTYDTSGLFDK